MSQLSEAKSPSPPSAMDLRHHLLREQVMLMCRYSRSSMIGGVPVALFVCFLISKDNSLLNVALWFVLGVLITALRIFLQSHFLNGRIAVTPQSLRLLWIGLAVHGFVWSLPSTWLLPNDPTYQVVLAVFLVGLTANIMSSLAPLPKAYDVFLLAMMLPIAALYFWMGGSFALSALGIVAYAAFMIGSAKRQTMNTADLLRLQLDNAALAANVQLEKEIVERANLSLQAQVEQRERVEADLRASKAEAEAANRAKSQFLANMSHELRTPLNGILGTTELLKNSIRQSGEQHKQLKYTNTILHAGERLTHLIDDILDMARIEAGSLRIERTDFSPQDATHEVVELLQPQLGEKQLTFALEIASDVPQQVRGDAHRVKQILTNLLANAIKFTAIGGVTVKLEVDSGDNRTIQLVWSIIDTGIGIAPEAQQHLFRPFTQLDESSTRKFGGSGLGLAISRQLVQALGGIIEVHSTVGEGSVFRFTLPFEVNNEHATAATKPAASALPATRGGRVLVAEDNATNGQLVTEMLSLAGCQTTMAVNGVEALDKLKSQRFDVVLMDWHMPEMDGVEATRIWREREELRGAPRTPIIALTASVLPGDRETCLKAGMDDFVGKPFTYDELVSTVRRWLPA